jgi:cellobiose-specific phosphotransferase system component IIA
MTYILLAAHEPHDSMMRQQVRGDMADLDNLIVHVQLSIRGAATLHVSHVVRLAWTGRR